MKFIKQYIIAFSTLLLIGFVNAEETRDSSGGPSDIALAVSLVQGDESQRATAVPFVTGRRDELVDALITIVSEPENRKGIHCRAETAIELLGELATENAIQFLVTNIDLRLDDISWNQDIFSEYASAKALFRAGLPAVRAIALHQTKPGSIATKEQRELGIEIICRILGRETARAYLREHSSSLGSAPEIYRKYLEIMDAEVPDLKTLLESEKENGKQK